MERKYRAVYCSHCDQTHIFQTSVVPGCQYFERVKCPECSRPLKAIRADDGYQLVASRPGDLGRSFDRLEEYTYPDDADALAELIREISEAQP